TAPRVVILGTSLLAQSIRQMCFSRGLGVRSPLDWESLPMYLSTMEPGTVVLVIDQLHQTATIAAALHALPETCSWMPISLVDSRGLSRPMRLHGRGPRALCSELHRAAFDPRWAMIIQELGAMSTGPD